MWIVLAIIMLIGLIFDYFTVTPRDEMIARGVIIATAVVLVAVFAF